MRYIPHTDDEIAEMLETIGCDSVDGLFSCIPECLRESAALNLPEPMSEPELLAHLGGLASRNTGALMTCFAGGGAYRHHTPALVDQLLLRSEFYTAYTPYQPEVSQGTLQAIFEFQTMIARLFDMEVSNASMYDGASSLAEAVLMAWRLTRKKRVLVSEAVHPSYRRVVETYIANLGFELVDLPLGENGRTDLQFLAENLDDSTAAVVLQSPNYFGVIEDLRNAGKIVGPAKTRFVVAVTEPLAYGMLAGPGKFGADIVCGEGQSFGLPVGFGGPYLGLFTVRQSDVRSMPGRVCGRTVDADGQPGYVLTLSTREQHIRRERATSNICTNQALCSLAAGIYLAIAGAEGLSKLAKINHAKSEYLKARLSSAGAQLPFEAPTFNEFVFETKAPSAEVLAELSDNGIIGGTPVPGSENRILACATETVSKQEIDRYVEIVQRSL
jgi:glycine cleavage system P protein (glycine dehydrogenase) subunit 1